MATCKLLIAPHQDDEALFCAYTLIREKPLVVVCTDSFIQPLRGDKGCDAETRRNESIRAAKLLGYPVVFLGIRDTDLTEENLEERLRHFDAETVYIPAVQGGNVHHDIVGRVGKRLFPHAKEYTTYTKTELWTRGNEEVVPTEEEKDLKRQALLCYTSQLNLPSTKPHFFAVVDKSEWFL